MPTKKKRTSKVKQAKLVTKKEPESIEGTIKEKEIPVYKLEITKTDDGTPMVTMPTMEMPKKKDLPIIEPIVSIQPSRENDRKVSIEFIIHANKIK